MKAFATCIFLLLLMSVSLLAQAKTASNLFTIVPVDGYSFPARILNNRVATGVYSVTNNNGQALNNNQVSAFPAGLAVETDLVGVAGSCGSNFNLGPGQSCFLILQAESDRATTIQGSPLVCYGPQSLGACTPLPVPVNVAVVTDSVGMPGLNINGLNNGSTITIANSQTLTVNNLSGSTYINHLTISLSANLTALGVTITDPNLSCLSFNSNCSLQVSIPNSVTDAVAGTLTIQGANTAPVSYGVTTGSSSTSTFSLQAISLLPAPFLVNTDALTIYSITNNTSQSQNATLQFHLNGNMNAHVQRMDNTALAGQCPYSGNGNSFTINANSSCVVELRATSSTSVSISDILSVCDGSSNCFFPSAGDEMNMNVTNDASGMTTLAVLQNNQPVPSPLILTNGQVTTLTVQMNNPPPDTTANNIQATFTGLPESVDIVYTDCQFLTSSSSTCTLTLIPNGSQTGDGTLAIAGANTQTSNFSVSLQNSPTPPPPSDSLTLVPVVKAATDINFNAPGTNAEYIVLNNGSTAANSITFQPDNTNSISLTDSGTGQDCATGIFDNANFNLASGSYCIVDLHIENDGTNPITISNGLQACLNSTCYSPDAGDELKVNIDSTTSNRANLRLSPTSIVLNPAMPSEASATVTVTNTSDSVTANNVGIMPVSNVTITSYGCDSIKPNGMCTIQLTATQNQFATATASLTGANITTPIPVLNVQISPLTFTLDNNPSDLHMQYRAIQVTNWDNTQPVTLSNINVMSNASYVTSCASDDPVCSGGSLPQCGGLLPGDTNCLVWVKAQDPAVNLLDPTVVDNIPITLQITTNGQTYPAVSPTFTTSYDLSIYDNRGDPGVEKWNGGPSWIATPPLSLADVYSLINWHGDLYAAGALYYPYTTPNPPDANTPVPCLGYYNGLEWQLFSDNTAPTCQYQTSPPLLFAPTIMAVLNNTLYVGGKLEPAGGLSYDPNVLSWDGSQWQDTGYSATNLGFGNDGPNDLLAWNGNLYASRNPPSIDSGSSSLVQQYTPGPSASWTNVGTNLNPGPDSVYGGAGLAIWNNLLYLAGAFGMNSDTTTAQNFAYYDNTSANWIAVPNTNLASGNFAGGNLQVWNNTLFEASGRSNTSASWFASLGFGNSDWNVILSGTLNYYNSPLCNFPPIMLATANKFYLAGQNGSACKFTIGSDTTDYYSYVESSDGVSWSAGPPSQQFVDGYVSSMIMMASLTNFEGGSNALTSRWKKWATLHSQHSKLVSHKHKEPVHAQKE